MDKTDPLILLRKSLNNPQAQFRTGQLEAIEKLTIDKQKLLVVQRTGWGKSSVYFISSKILRDQGKGPAIIISPLLALMRNQIEAAERLGIKAVSINSTNYEAWSQLKKDVLEDRVDAVLISPERLANERFVEEVLYPIADKIGLFVVDEAHCISDWGHDFRPDYRRIVGILKVMPAGMPVLGTTATANNRVVDDIKEQLGGINVIRGSLTRESLSLQNIVLPDQASRLAWLSENIPKMEGSGIVYVLTKKDARIVAEWLIRSGIDAAAYYSGVEDPNFEDSNAYREYMEDMLYNNELKVLVASTALGMGYDKPDLSFVVHYQAPGSIIAYYQQIEAQVAEMMKGLQDSERPSVLVLQYSDDGGEISFKVPPASYLQTTMVQNAGGNPVWLGVDGGSDGWIQVGLEQIAVWNPDVIFVVNYAGDSVETAQQLVESKNWEGLQATKNGQVYGYPSDYASWDLIDPRWILGQQWLATILQPERAAGIDLHAQVISFYHDLYRLSETQIEESILPRLDEIK